MSKTTRTIPIIQTRRATPTIINVNEEPSYSSGRGHSVTIAKSSSPHPDIETQLTAPSSYNHVREASPAYRPPPTDAAAEPMLERKTSIDVIGDKVIGMLDEIERRVEHLRQTASAMEEEREALLEMLGTLQMNKDMLRLGPGELEDVEATMDRLMSRCRTVDVMVNTPRNKDQQRALVNVNEQIEGLLHNINDDISKGKQTCQGYLNACDPELTKGAVDTKFQSIVIECTADDQKRIRRRLAQLKTQIERAEKSINPTY